MRLIGTMLLLLLLPTAAQALGVRLSWNAGTADSDIAGYKVYYSTVSPEGPFTATDAAEGPSPLDVGFTGSATLTGLPADTPHYFTVTAYNDQRAESGFSRIVCNYWMPALQFPGDGASSVSTDVTLRWSAPADPQGYSYTLHYGTNPSYLHALPVGDSGRGPGLPRPPAGLALLLASLLLSGVPLTGRRRWLPATALAATLLVSCGGGGGSTVEAVGGSDGLGLTATSASLSLAANTTYYWKVKADNGAVVTESELYSFTTAR